MNKCSVHCVSWGLNMVHFKAFYSNFLKEKSKTEHQKCCMQVFFPVLISKQQIRMCLTKISIDYFMCLQLLENGASFMTKKKPAKTSLKKKEKKRKTCTYFNRFIICCSLVKSYWLEIDQCTWNTYNLASFQVQYTFVIGSTDICFGSAYW